MTEKRKLEEAIAQLEAQRATLGDEVVDAAVDGLHQKLDALAPQRESTRRAGERKLVTVMFADISGFTSMAESMDPEAVSNLMSGCFDRLVPCITRYEGTIDKFIGDEIMALFGAPLAHENDAERAVRAALDMEAELSAFNVEHGLDLGLHFGINTGLVLAGDIGAGDQQSYTVMGDAVNLAARLENLAERGQIIIGSATYQLVRPLFEFVELSPVKVKGKSKPVSSFQVLDLRVEPGRVRGLERQGLVSSLVGREPDLEAIKRAIDRVQSGQGQIVGIIGEAGLGKSRLLLEASRQSSVATSSLLWLQGEALSYSRTISYWPFQMIFRRWAGILAADSELTALQKLEAHLRKVTKGETPEYLPYIASLLSLAAVNSYSEQIAHLDSEAMGKRIFKTVRNFVRRLATMQPTVLAFEDLHWMDESSASMLRHLLPLVEEVPLLVVGVSRPEVDGPGIALQEEAMSYSERYTEIRLQPLAPDDSFQLFNNLLNIDGLPAQTRSLMIEKAEGNPFYLEELIRTIITSGEVIYDRRSGNWQINRQINNLILPDTVQGVVMARVDRLDETSRKVLQIAAVIGRTFSNYMLRMIAGDEADLDQVLLELQEQGLIITIPGTAEPVYGFKHALTQEAVYEGILHQTRRELHDATAKSIEAKHSDRLEEFYGLLSYHYALAEQWEVARSYMLLAGDRAGDIAADKEAVALYRQAIGAYEQAFSGRLTPAERADIYRKMGEAYFRLGNNEEALDYLQRALTDLGHPLPRGRSAERLVLLGALIEQAWHRLRGVWAKRIEPSVIDPKVVLVARIYESLMWITGVNPEKVLLISLSAVNFSERNGYRPGLIINYGWLQLLLDFAGLARMGDYYGRESLALVDETLYPTQSGTSYAFRAVHENIFSRWAETLDYTRRANEILQDKNHWNVRAWSFSNLASADGNIHLGNFAAALEYAVGLSQFGEESADRQAWCFGMSRQGFAFRGLGQTEAAIESLHKAMELSIGIPDYQTYVDSAGELGHCLIRQGKVGEALMLYEECAKLAGKHNLMKSPVITRYLNGRADALLRLAEGTTGAEREGHLNNAIKACREALKQGKAYLPGMPEALMLAGRKDWLLGNRSAANSYWERSIALATSLDVQFDLGRTYLEAGSRLENIDYLRRADVIFARIDASWELAKAQQELAALLTDDIS